MRKLKIFFSIITVLVLICAGGFYAFNYAMKASIESARELDAYLEPMFQKLSDTEWDRNTVENYASPALKEDLSDQDLIDIATGLGKIINYRGIEEIESRADSTVYIRVLLEGDNTPARATIFLSKHGKRWLMDSMEVEPMTREEANFTGSMAEMGY